MNGVVDIAITWPRVSGFPNSDPTGTIVRHLDRWHPIRGPPAGIIQKVSISEFPNRNFISNRPFAKDGLY